jgi:Fic family protein
MDIGQFSMPAGKLVPTHAAHMAYKPHPLPPVLDLRDLIHPLGEAIQLIGELKGAARRIENPYILVEPLQRREALTTSAMEGTNTTIEKLALADEELGAPADEDATESRNYIVALRAAVEDMEKFSISHRVIRAAHRELLSGLSNERGASKKPGEYRTSQNWIGGSDISRARFIPPPPDAVQSCMDQLEKYINRDEQRVVQKLIDLALAHYQFEAIHPFLDGNGRIGRMLITLMAMQSKLLDLPLLFLSPYLESHKNEYVDRMHGVSTRSQWSEWMNFFLEAINATCRDTIMRIDSLIALQRDYRARAMRHGRSIKLLDTVDQMFIAPFTTVPRMADQHKITYRAAQQIIEKLERAGVLSESPGHYPKLFVASEVLAISNRQ